MTGDDRNLRAAEYVLGTLPAEERAALARELESDAGLQRDVRAWEDRLAGLQERVAEVTPPAAVWDRVQERMSIDRAPPGTEGAGAQVIQMRRSLRLWRGIAAGAGALAAMLAAVVALDRVRPQVPAEASYVAAVNRGGELPTLIIRVDGQRGLVHVRALNAEPPPERSLELWIIGKDAAPRSFGVVGEGAAPLVLPAAVRGSPVEGAILAITVEPKGGSPTVDPSGPPIYSGKLVRD